MKKTALILCLLALLSPPAAAQESPGVPATPDVPAVSGAADAPPAAAPAVTTKKWEMLPAASSLSFSGKQMDTDFTGVFKTFAADIHFDPADLAASKAVVTVDLTSVDTQDKERDTNLKGREFFNVEKFPSARFETTQIRQLNDGGYEALGTLTIGAITAPVTLFFTLDIKQDGDGKETALMKGQATLDRSAWRLGTGDWADPGIIANSIVVDVIVAAVNNPQGAPAP